MHYLFAINDGFCQVRDPGKDASLDEIYHKIRNPQLKKDSLLKGLILRRHLVQKQKHMPETEQAV